VLLLESVGQVVDGRRAPLRRQLAHGIAAGVYMAPELGGALTRGGHAPGGIAADGIAALAAIGFAVIVEHEADRAVRGDARAEAFDVRIVVDLVARGRPLQRPHQLARELWGHAMSLPCPP
jgi:hypothetical protein